MTKSPITNIRELHDIKGWVIRPGDLVRTYHFTGSRGKIHYLYHVATKAEYGIKLLPAEWADPNRKHDGGAHYPTQSELNGLSAIILNNYGHDTCGELRKRVKP